MRLSRTLLVQPLLPLLVLGAVTFAGPAPGEPSAPAAECSERVVFVLESSGLEGLRKIFADQAEHLRRADAWPRGQGSRELASLLLRLGPGHCVDLVWPRTAEAGATPGTEYVLLVSSPWYELGDESLAELLVEKRPIEPAERLADAVAVAATGLGDPPAAVVLVTAAGAEDGSRLGEGEAVAVLERAGVPLRIWVLDGQSGPPAWDGATVERVEIGGWEDLERAVDALRDLVEAAP